MIRTRFIQSEKDFKGLKKGDFVAVEWKQLSYHNDNKTIFGVYKIVENKVDQNEIILQTKHNIYFNYNMFLEPEKHGVSNLKQIMKIRSVD